MKMSICGDDPRNGNVKKTCPINPIPGISDGFECYLCGNTFDSNPRQNELSQFNHDGEDMQNPSSNKIDIEHKKKQTNIKEYQEDEEWENSCVSVPKGVERLANSDVLSQMDKEHIRVKRLLDATFKGYYVNTGTYTKLQKAYGKANQILGISGGGESKWERFNPPFQRVALMDSTITRAEDQGSVQEGTTNIIFTSIGAVVRIFLDSGLPPRNFYLRNKLINGAPKNDQTYDGIHLFTRVAFELFLNMESRMNIPWSLSRWISQCGLQHNHIQKLIEQGGPMSRDFWNTLTKHNREIEYLNISWEDFVNEYVSNILKRQIIILSEDDESNTITKVNDILNFIKEKQSAAGVSWSQQFLEKFCTIGYINGEEWGCSGFWCIEKGNRCSNKITMKMPSILVGQAVAQAIQEVFDNKEIMAATILTIIENDLHWTTDDKGRAMKLTWKRMMNKRSQGSCWEV